MARFTRIQSATSGRRSFLAQLGLMGSALAGVSVVGKSAPAPTDSSAHMHAEGRIGLLMPSATLCRGLDEHLLAGFGLALDQVRQSGGDLQIDLVRTTAGLSSTAYKKAAERLLQNDQVDLVVALAQPGAVSAMAPVFEEANRCLVMVDGGANLVRAGEQGRHIFYNTLGQWESNWALGRWAARTYRGDGFMVASGFEAGHDSLRAFRLGAESTGSGEKGFHIPRMPLRESLKGLDPANSVEWIRRTSPAYVVALLGGTEGREFLRAFHQAGLTGHIPIVGSAFLAEEAMEAGLSDCLVGFTTASAWSPALPSSANRAFMADYQRRTGHEADAFASLGFDTGRMLLAAMQDSGGHARFVRDGLERAVWAGPGGHRTMDISSHTTHGDIHLTRFDLYMGRSQPLLIQSEQGLENQAQEVSALLRSARPALVNPYPVY